MSKFFNVSAGCQPDIHYMVDLTERLKKIKVMVDAGQYFTINRARQYGKTTLLQALGEFLKNDYVVVSLDFQMMSHADFENEQDFAAAFSREILENVETLPEEIRKTFTNISEGLEIVTLPILFKILTAWCGQSERRIVLIIDEVDSATNNQVFLDFLAQLRGYYIRRRKTPTFQSVILAGVYDVKNLKRKFVADDEHKVNSPWNTRAGNEENGRLRTFDDCPRDYREPAPYSIAADFLIDMSFSVKDIAGMLSEYENDYKTGMNLVGIAGLIYDYTSGYPFLVSRICKLMDERIAGSEAFPSKKAAWTRAGVLKAVQMLLNEKNTLFESLTGKLNEYPELKRMLSSLLFQGKSIIYNPDDETMDMAFMFGFVKLAEDGTVVVANRIFETRLYNLFLTTAEAQESDIYRDATQHRNQFIQDGRLNMTLVLEKFVAHFDELYGDKGAEFLEEDGRRYFLLYLRPIINGVGNYYIEARTRNMERTDVIVDYLGQQFVIELKIWRGNEYHTRGEAQLLAYLDYYHLKKGYMLSFNFNKKKQIGVKELHLGDKVLVEAVV